VYELSGDLGRNNDHFGDSFTFYNIVIMGGTFSRVANPIAMYAVNGFKFYAYSIVPNHIYLSRADDGSYGNYHYGFRIICANEE